MSEDAEHDPAWIARLGRCTGNHRDSMIAVAEGLVCEIPDLWSRLGRACQAGNAPEVQRYAHTLKSSFRYICDGLEVTSAEQIELLGREGRIDDATELLDELRPRVSYWTETIQAWLDQQQG